MTPVIEMPSAAPDRAELHPLLLELYTQLTGILRADGGPEIAPEVPAAEYWARVAAYLPPRGATALARDPESGRLLGCGTLEAIGDGMGELRRLYVRPEARRTGLGGRLVAARIEAARAIGLRVLLVDTLRTNTAMQALYATLGFETAPPHAESGSVAALPQLAPFMVYYRMEL